MAPTPTLLGGRTFAWGERTYVMGVLNVTPDSFSDGGQFGSVDAAVRQGEALIAAGADLLDVGGESTRPGADAVPDQVEAERVLPVLSSGWPAGFPSRSTPGRRAWPGRRWPPARRW